RIEEIRPALGLGQPPLGEKLRVEPEPERAGVDADRPVLGLLGLADGPLLEVHQLRRLVLEGEPFLRSLQMRVPGAAPPDVTLRVRGLRLDLGVVLARALAGHADLDAGGALERRDHRAAPLLLDRAVDHQLPLGPGPRGYETSAEPDQECDERPNQ